MHLEDLYRSTASPPPFRLSHTRVLTSTDGPAFQLTHTYLRAWDSLGRDSRASLFITLQHPRTVRALSFLSQEHHATWSNYPRPGVAASEVSEQKTSTEPSLLISSATNHTSLRS